MDRNNPHATSRRNNPHASQSQPCCYGSERGATMALPPSVPKPGPVAVGAQILRSEGPLGLFSGVSATILRQAIYSTTRMGLYDFFKKKWSPDDDGASLPLHLKIAAGFVSGGIAAAVGNPADVAMVRMQADARLPITERRNYKSVGIVPDNQPCHDRDASQLATYDQAKEAIRYWDGGERKLTDSGLTWQPVLP